MLFLILSKSKISLCGKPSAQFSVNIKLTCYSKKDYLPTCT